MAANKANLLLEQFEANISREKFFLDQNDRDSLIQVLREQEDLIPELLRQMEFQPSGEPFMARLRAAADARSQNEQKVAGLLGEISRELGRLRQSAKRLHDWQKAWLRSEAPGGQLANTYA